MRKPTELSTPISSTSQQFLILHEKEIYARSKEYQRIRRIALVRCEVFTAVTMKNAVIWDIKTQFVLHRRHITFPLQSPAGYCYVRFEVFTAVTMKNVAFWVIKTEFILHRRHITSPLQSPAC
jgi:hypothetical protein